MPIIFSKKLSLAVILVVVPLIVIACGEKEEDLPTFSLQGSTIAYIAQLQDGLSDDGKPVVKIEYVRAVHDGQTIKKANDMIEVFSKDKLNAYRGLRLQAGDSSYLITSLNADYEKGIIYSIVPVNPQVNKDTPLAVKYPAVGTSPTFVRQGYTFTYDAYFLDDLSDDGLQVVMIDYLSATDGQTTLDRPGLGPVLGPAMESETPPVLMVEGKSYPVNKLQAFTKEGISDLNNGADLNITLAMFYSTVNLPMDIPRNAQLKLE